MHKIQQEIGVRLWNNYFMIYKMANKLIGFEKKEQAKAWIRNMNKKNKEMQIKFMIPVKNRTKLSIKKYIDKKRRKPIYIVSN